MSSPVEEVVAALEAADVKYLIVGGVAVVLHGHLRTTADLDLIVGLQGDNPRRAIDALVAIGYRPRAPVAPQAFADRAQREAWVRDKNLQVFSLWRAGSDLEVDLFVREPLDFAAAYGRALRVELDDGPATVVALIDLIALKTAAGRPQDLADIAALEALEGEDHDGGR